MTNTAIGNGPYSGISLVGATSAGNVIDANTVSGNNAAYGSTNQTDGIRLEVDVNHTTVSNNRIDGAASTASRASAARSTTS